MTRRATGNFDQRRTTTNMTIELIQQRIQYIKENANDDEVAHSCEDYLRREFIEYVATLDIPSLAEKAKLVLTTTEIDFERWYA